MFALLSPRLWIALALAGALAFSHFTAYRSGKNYVRLEWNAAKAVANDEARRLEQRRQSMVDEAGAAAAKRATALRADAGRARRESDGLRDDLGAVRLHAAQSIAAANDSVRVLGDVLQSCTEEYLSVAGKVDAAYSEVKTLREAWPK